MKKVIGQMIVAVEWLTESEALSIGFSVNERTRVQKIILSDGTFLTAMADEEGNGPGGPCEMLYHLLYSIKQG